MNEERGYRCLRCGHLGARISLPEGLAVTATCAVCGSYDLEVCAIPADLRTVPVRVLRSAESQAMYWKRQAEALSRVVNAAIQNGVLVAPYAGEAQRIMAGMA
jgi:hypothetical protein